jgi:hypothetical protein
MGTSQAMLASANELAIEAEALRASAVGALDGIDDLLTFAKQ